MLCETNCGCAPHAKDAKCTGGVRMNQNTTARELGQQRCESSASARQDASGAYEEAVGWYTQVVRSGNRHRSGSCEPGHWRVRGRHAT